MINIILAEDHVLLREGLVALLKDEKDINIVGEAANGIEVKEILAHKHADVLIADINMPLMDGIETVRFVKQNYPHMHVMMLSMLEDEKYVADSFELGALGYILKTTRREELIFAIRKVASGEPYISHKISHNLISRSSGIKVTPRIDALPELHFSDREFEILNLIAEGFTNSEIADKIFVSKRTVETHRKSLMEKTNTRNTAALIKFTLINGIIK